MSHFNSFQDLLTRCNNDNLTIAEATTLEESAETGQTAEVIRTRANELLNQMEATINEGINSNQPSMSGLCGGDAQRLMGHLNAKTNVLNPLGTRLLAYGVATLEENSRMHRIVACPTAGGSGSVPAVLIALEHEHGLDRQQTIDGLITAGCIGGIVAKRMHLSGAAAGCQAEVGVASGMAAGGMVAAMGGTPQQVLNAAAISMQNLMGLVCDPVAGLVEVPCVLRNGLGALQSVGAATMAMADIVSFIPIDEVVDAMAHVGKLMPRQLKETAEGGLATTQTAEAFTQQLFSPE
jgi:L-serine dehydratase